MAPALRPAGWILTSNMADANGPHAQLIMQTFLPDGRMELEAALSLLDEDVDWDMSRSPFPDARLYRGVDGVREWFRGLAQAFGEVVYEIERVHEEGIRLAVQFRVRGRGPSSGIPVDYRFVPLLTFRAGKIVRMERHDEWGAAIAAMGDRSEGT